MNLFNWFSRQLVPLRPFSNIKVTTTNRKRVDFPALVALGIGLSFLLVSGSRSLAGTLTFNFDDGVGIEFVTGNTSNFWTLGTAGPTFRVAKPADNGSILPNDFIAGGISSTFAMTGDFLVTVDFSLLNFPAGPHANALNESVLSVAGNAGNEVFLVLRVRRGSADEIEVYADNGSSVVVLGLQNSSLANGRYQIERVGSTLTGRFAPAGGDVFTTLGSHGNYISTQFRIGLTGVQGFNVPGLPRSNTALDVAFDNLVAQAEGFVSTVPPLIQTIARAGAEVVVSGTNGLQGNSYYVLTSTNVVLPKIDWTSVATNSFGAGGGFRFTNALSTTTPQQFYLIQSP